MVQAPGVPQPSQPVRGGGKGARGGGRGPKGRAQAARGGGQPAAGRPREVVQVGRAQPQCYALPARPKAKTSDTVITGTILYLFDIFVGGFYGSIHLRSTGCGILVLDFESLTHSSHQITVEIGVIIGNDGLGYSESANNTIFDKVCDDLLGYNFVVGDPSIIVPVETIEVNEELSYKEVPVAILDRQVRKLRNNEIASVKVLWQNQQVEEATWEAEEEMRKKYPHLFE
ncbi:uncharacterized protein [Nicotiana sylvestris]|uniref:uncharacterized protein n=1 Tax=Nicotiana sylvestris TaxID=4096 RepID=UPI00388C4CCD